jgi:hypothetical protein
MGRKTEVSVEGVGLHDMVDVRRAVEAVGRSGEAGVGAVQVQVQVRVRVRVREPVSEWGRKQGGLNSLLQAYAKRREKFRKDKIANSYDSPEEWQGLRFY